MDRDTLTYLLRSGKFLCFDPAATIDRAAEAEREGLDVKRVLADGGSEGAALLFDSPYLTDAVFFKEAAIDHEDELYIETRALLLFNENNALEGGASTECSPDSLESALIKWFGGKVDIRLSLHDRAILEVFCKTPTFDPFLLLAQRQDLELVRKVPEESFSVPGSVAQDVQDIISERARALVALAMDGSEDADRIAFTVDSLRDAIWTCQPNTRTGRLFSSLGIPKDQTGRILFAWKGIAYYDYLFRSFGADYAEFLTWLRDEDSLPKDMSSIESARAQRLAAQRRTAQTVMRGYYTHATEILKKHERAYAALVDAGNPEPFQKFLLAAPRLFETLGISIGSFGHASNAFRALTNNGRRPRRKADALEPYFRFISNLAAAKLN